MTPRYPSADTDAEHNWFEFTDHNGNRSAIALDTLPEGARINPHGGISMPRPSSGRFVVLLRGNDGEITRLPIEFEARRRNR